MQIYFSWLIGKFIHGQQGTLTLHRRVGSVSVVIQRISHTPRLEIGKVERITRRQIRRFNIRQWIDAERIIAARRRIPQMRRRLQGRVGKIRVRRGGRFIWRFFQYFLIQSGHIVWLDVVRVVEERRFSIGNDFVEIFFRRCYPGFILSIYGPWYRRGTWIFLTYRHS